MTRRAGASDLQGWLGNGAGAPCAALGIERWTQASIPIDGRGLRVALETDGGAPRRRAAQIGEGGRRIESEIEIRASGARPEAQQR